MQDELEDLDKVGRAILREAGEEVGAEVTDAVVGAAADAAGLSQLGALWPAVRPALFSAVQVALRAPADRRVEAFRKRLEANWRNEQQRVELAATVVGALSESHWQLLRNQARLGDTLGSVEGEVLAVSQRTLELLRRIEETHEIVLRHSIGKGAKVFARAVYPGPETVHVMLHNDSEAPAFDIHFELVVLSNRWETEEPPHGKIQRAFELGGSKAVSAILFPDRTDRFFQRLGASRAVSPVAVLSLEDRDALDFNIFIQHRSGRVQQQVRIRRLADGKRPMAVRTHMLDDGDVSHDISDDFPGWPSDDPDSLFRR